MRGNPVWLARVHAETALADFRGTAAIRGWSLLACAVMRNHVHLVVGVSGDPDPATLLHAFKSHSSRVLSAVHERTAGGRWWTQSGLRPALREEVAVIAAVRYVLAQYEPLVTWHAHDIDPTWLEHEPPG